MTIRLTDLDQDEQIPIEQMRDPIGVLLVSEGGWSAVSVKGGVSESGAGAPSGLPGTTGWVANCSYEKVKGLKMTIGRPDLRLRTSDWFRPDLDEMIEEWAADRYALPRQAELLAKAVDRVMRLTYEAIRIHAGLSPSREQALLNMVDRSASLATGLRIVLAPEMERDVPNEKRLTVATYSAMKFGAFVLDDSTLLDGEVPLRLRPPRMSYAERILSRPVPAQGKWQQAKLDRSDLLTPELLGSLRELGRPVLISARVQPVRGAEDPFLTTWTVPSGHGYVRKTYPLEEVIELASAFRFHDLIIMVGPGWKEPSAAGLLRAVKTACGADALAHASWSAGVVAENVLCAAMRNGRAPKGESEGVTNPESVWIGAHDRIAMRPYVNALAAFGATLMGGYAGGIRFKTPQDPELISGTMNAGWELGLHGQMGFIRRAREMGAEIIADQELFGGPREHVIAPLLAQGVRVGPLWRIDEIMSLTRERRVGAFLHMLGE